MVVLLSASGAMADIDFASMPVGCSWTVEYSSGAVLTETFLGKKQGKYKVKVTEADNPNAIVRTVTFNRERRMVRKDWADGNWETFTPYSCFATAGSCTYRYRNSSGEHFMVESTTKAKGKGFTVQAGPVGGTPYNDDYFETGAFGLMTTNTSANYASRMVSLMNCGADS